MENPASYIIRAFLPSPASNREAGLLPGENDSPSQLNNPKPPHIAMSFSLTHKPNLPILLTAESEFLSIQYQLINEAPEEAWMLLELQEGALAGRKCTVRFQPEFQDAT